MICYEIVTLTKVRKNSKKWSYSGTVYQEEPKLPGTTDRVRQFVHCWKNAPSIDAVRELNEKCKMIVMAPLGFGDGNYTFDYEVIKSLAESATTCSVTKKKIFMVYPHKN